MLSRYVWLIVFLPALLNARIIDVPGDYEHIQDAIDASSDGDSVLVQPGSYVENLDYSGKSISIGSLVMETGNIAYRDSTIIDGDRNGSSVVTISGIEDDEASLIGFTVQNGMADYGGGVRCYQSDATVESCLIIDNTAIQYGGGIACIESGMFIFNCTIQENETDNGGGGGIYCEGSSLGILYCNISYNSTDIIDGGGVYSTDSNPYITNCTIVMNSVDSHGGGIFCRDFSEITVTNTILWGNLPQQIWMWEDNRLTVTYSDVEGGQEEVVTDRPEANLRWREGNFEADPLFNDVRERDLGLSWSNFPVNDRTKSPCIDQGDPDSPFDSDQTPPDLGAITFIQRPAVSIQPRVLDFVDAQVGWMEWLEVDIANIGGGVLRILSQEINPVESPFVIGRGGGEQDLVHGDLHQTWIRFYPLEPQNYQAILRIVSNDVDSGIVDVEINGTVLRVDDLGYEIPLELDIAQVYPNPFNSNVRITFTSPSTQRVSLRLIDPKGCVVAVLIDDEVTFGRQTVEFDGDALSEGLYFVCLEGEETRCLRKLILVK